MSDYEDYQAVDEPLAPVAKPFFRWNHDVIMGWGEDGLKRRLGI